MQKRLTVLVLSVAALVFVSGLLTGCSEPYKVGVTNACSFTIVANLDGAISDAASIEPGKSHTFHVNAKGHETFILNLTVSRNGTVLGNKFINVSGVTSVTVSESEAGGVEFSVSE